MEHPTLSPEPGGWRALALIGLEALVVLGFEALWIPAFQHSFGAWLGWYVAYLMLAGGFFIHAYLLLIGSGLYRRRTIFGLWGLVMLLVAARIILATEQFVALLKPLA